MTSKPRAEGFFIPGKSADQVKAEARQETARRQTETVSMTLTVEELDQLEKVGAEMPYLMAAARDVFDLLRTGFAGGWLQGSEVNGLLELCGRGLEAAEAVEGKAIFMLDGKVREILKVRALERFAAEAVEQSGRGALSGS